MKMVQIRDFRGLGMHRLLKWEETGIKSTCLPTGSKTRLKEINSNVRKCGNIYQDEF